MFLHSMKLKAASEETKAKCESAAQGLRKTLLKRPWCPRCSACGVRHEDIEFSTCKFWQAWVV